MRLWISPELEKIVVSESSSHSRTIVDDPLRYDVDPDAIATYMREIEHEDADAQFDYETIISLAQMAGWVRVSGTESGQVEISAADTRHARRAIRSLLEDGYHLPRGIGFELSRIEGHVIASEFRFLDAEALDVFVDKGRLPPPRRGDMVVEQEAVALVETVLEFRTVAPQSSPQR